MKGGTALNLFVFDLPRLSVDIDLNYLGSADRDVMLAEREKVEQAIMAICGREGFVLRRVPQEHAGGKWRLGYTNALGRNANLEIDVVFTLRVPLWPVQVRDSHPVGSFQVRNIPILDIHELAAGKLSALFSRQASRDLFDAHALLSRSDLEREKLRLGFVVYGASSRRDWRTLSLDDIRCDQRELQQQLIPVLRGDAVPVSGEMNDWMERLISECRDRLAPLRDELLRGDMRPLYLGWLAGVSAGEVDEKTAEPQPPPGLSRLTAAQQSLVEFLEVDEDLLAAAGLADPQGSKPDGESDAELDVWIAVLSAAEKTAMLKLLLTGHAQQAERELKLRFLAWRREQQPVTKPPMGRRTVAELYKLAASAAKTRKRQEAVRRKKAEAERQAKRETRLRTLAADFDHCWRIADKRAERGIASAYDEVKRSLVDLSDAYALCATRAGFDRKLVQFMARHGKRGALVRRLADAGLWKKSSR